VDSLRFQHKFESPGVRLAPPWEQQLTSRLLAPNRMQLSAPTNMPAGMALDTMASLGPFCHTARSRR
jgi:hypothetical protein